jgi:hypothetical protein
MNVWHERNSSFFKRRVAKNLVLFPINIAELIPSAPCHELGYPTMQPGTGITDRASIILIQRV